MRYEAKWYPDFSRGDWVVVCSTIMFPEPPEGCTLGRFICHHAVPADRLRNESEAVAAAVLAQWRQCSGNPGFPVWTDEHMDAMASAVDALMKALKKALGKRKTLEQVYVTARGAAGVALDRALVGA